MEDGADVGATVDGENVADEPIKRQSSANRAPIKRQSNDR